jgi:hypothetical protein
MAIAGYQEFWLAGSRFFFLRDPILGVAQPMVNLGVVNPISPTTESTLVELFDSDGGVNTRVASDITAFSEDYEITCSNLSPSNLALVFRGDQPETWSQAEAIKRVTHALHTGHIAKLKDTDGTFLYSVNRIVGVSSVVAAGVLSTTAVSGVVSSTRTISIGDDLATANKVVAGSKIILTGTGLVDPTIAGTYTVESVGTGPDVIVVEEAISADETFTGSLIYKDLETVADTGTVFAPDIDYTLDSGPRGMIRVVPGGGITTGDYEVLMHLDAVASGPRLILPQQNKTEVTGQGWIFWSRGNKARETVREARVALTPGTATIGNEAYSNFTLTARVLSEITDATSGRLISAFGAVPTIA